MSSKSFEIPKIEIELNRIEKYRPPIQDRGKDSADKIEQVLLDYICRHKARKDDPNYNENYVDVFGSAESDRDKEILTYDDILNKDIAKKADVKERSLYQWYGDGKETILKVLYYKYRLKHEENIEYFFRVANSSMTIEQMFLLLNSTTRSSYDEYPEIIPLYYSKDIPTNLIDTLDDPRRDSASVFFHEAGVPKAESKLAAEIAYYLTYITRRESTKLVLNKKSSNGYSVQYNTAIEDEMVKMLSAYTKSYKND